MLTHPSLMHQYLKTTSAKTMQSSRKYPVQKIPCSYMDHHIHQTKTLMLITFDSRCILTKGLQEMAYSKKVESVQLVITGRVIDDNMSDILQ